MDNQTIGNNDAPRIRTVFFDVGHTLLKPGISEARVFTEAAAQEGVQLDPAAVERYMPMVYEYYEELYEQDDSFWSDEERATGIWIAMYEYLCQLAGVTHSANAIARRVHRRYLDPFSWTPFNDVLPALDALKGMGIQMGLISNWDLSLQSVIEGLDMGHYFSSIISSAAVRMHKPQQGIFELALRQTGTTAVEALHVGDHLYADVQGARLAGIKPVFIDREGIGHSGDFLSIRSLDQLVDIVQD